MKRNPLIPALIAVMLISACKKEPVSQNRAVAAGEIIPTNHTLSGVLGNYNTVEVFHLTSDIEWHLNGLVFINAGDQLIIDPGTVIKADPSYSSAVAGGGLVITRGAKIDARGTAAAPIVFTSAAANPVSGDCAGLVIIGNAPSNHLSRATVEGLYYANIYAADCTYGSNIGTDPADNSGYLQYVRIEYAGFEESVGNEINGLTLAGVGSGTTIDHIEIYKAKDDAIEFFGGTVNVSYLIAVDAQDDLFDFDNGYRGTISYALGLTDSTRADKSGSNGIECDNNYYDGNFTNATPITRPVIDHMTIIGLSNPTKASITNGQTSGTGFYYCLADIRRYAQFSIQNSLFMGFNRGLYLENSTACDYANGLSTMSRNIFHGYVSAYSYTSATCSPAIGTTNIAYINGNANLATQLASPFTRPSTSSAANWFPASTSSPAQILNVGAFAIGTTDWTAGWSRY